MSHDCANSINIQSSAAVPVSFTWSETHTAHHSLASSSRAAAARKIRIHRSPLPQPQKQLQLALILHVQPPTGRKKKADAQPHSSHGSSRHPSPHIHFITSHGHHHSRAHEGMGRRRTRTSCRLARLTPARRVHARHVREVLPVVDARRTQMAHCHGGHEGALHHGLHGVHAVAHLQEARRRVVPACTHGHGVSRGVKRRSTVQMP